MLEHVAALNVLVDAVVVVKCPGLGTGGVHHVAAKGKIGLVISQDSHDGGHDARLLHHHIVAQGSLNAAVGGEKGDGDGVEPQVGLVDVVGGIVGVVGSEHKQGVFVPRLLCRLLKEMLECHVGVTHTLVDGVVSLLGELLLQLLGHLEWMVARSGEHRCHKRFFIAIEFAHHKLEERLVPYRPHAVVVAVAVEVRVGVKLGATQILLIACGAGKCLKAHRTVLCPVEECRVVALAVELARESAQVVHRRWGEEERLNHHGNARENRRHGIDALAPVGVTVLESHRLAEQRVNEWGVTLVFAAVEVMVKETHVFLAKTLNDEYHHVLGSE